VATNLSHSDRNRKNAAYLEYSDRRPHRTLKYTGQDPERKTRVSPGVSWYIGLYPLACDLPDFQILIV
jgi:hypothetical protein